MQETIEIVEFAVVISENHTFRELAGEFRRRAAIVRSGVPLAANASEYETDWTLCERAGLAIIAAHDAGLLTLAGLPDVMAWYQRKKAAPKGWPRDLSRIPRNVLTIVAGVTRFDDRPPGLLAVALPAIFPPASHKHAIDFRRAHPDKGEPGDIADLHRELGAIQQEEIARSLDVLAKLGTTRSRQRLRARPWPLLAREMEAKWVKDQAGKLSKAELEAT